MSKFLKFIVHLVIILTMLDVLALAVPPFLGINTAIIDGNEQSNMPVGSVTYAKPVSVSELQVGDSILEQESGSVYRLKINSIDSSSGVFNVYDQTDVESGERAINLRNTAPKVIITIGYIGYLIIATQSTEGLIIIGLAILFLIILFILAELWRKDKSAGDVGEFEDGAEDRDAVAIAAAEGAGIDEAAIAEQPMTKRQLKKEMKRRAKEDANMDKKRAKQELKEATRQLKEENKARKKEAKRLKKEAKKRARTGGFVEDYDPVEAQLADTDPAIRSEAAADEANQLLRQEIAAATQEGVGDTQDVVIPKKETSAGDQSASEEASVQAQPEEASAADEPAAEGAGIGEAAVQERAPEEETGPVEYKKMAIPIYTEEELLSRAHAAGDEPEVIRDEEHGITLLDYSDIIIEEK